MRSITIGSARIALALVLAIAAVVLQRDRSFGADGAVLYAWTAPSPPDPTFGSAVASGDVNGDGEADVIVGAPGVNRVDVFSGANGTLLYSLDMPVPVAGAQFGAAVAAGDVDGDGKADVIVGAPFENVGANSGQGRVYIFSGDTGALLDTLDTPNPGPSGNFGAAVAAGDFDGDGNADVAVGAPSETIAPNSSTGRVYLFSGADGSLARTFVTDPGSAGEFGVALAAGDVNADAHADIVIGAWLGTFVGNIPVVGSYAYVFSGADGSQIRILQRPVYARDAKFGSALATADTNGDGAADIIVGDPPDGPFVLAGSAYVFDGATGSLLWTLSMPPPVPAGTPSFGASVAGGDVDGDGKADAIIGSLPDAFDDPGVGRVSVFSGADGALLEMLHAPTSPNQRVGVSFGAAVAAADVTGTGNAAVIAGAPNTWFDSNPGQAYVFAPDGDGDGCADAKEPLLAPPISPLDPWDFFSVPVPALAAAQYPTTVFRDGSVSSGDAQAVFAYFKAHAIAGTPVSDQDLNENGVADGIEYDRTVAGPGKSGPPDGAVTAQDAQLAFAQFKMGYHC